MTRWRAWGETSSPGFSWMPTRRRRSTPRSGRTGWGTKACSRAPEPRRSSPPRSASPRSCRAWRSAPTTLWETRTGHYTGERKAGRTPSGSTRRKRRKAMLRQILTYPDPFLSTRALPVKRVDGKLRDLIRDMFETMYASKGIGLAATQVGVGKRVIVVDVSPAVEEEVKPLALVNPEIVEKRGWVEGTGGCLSVPGVEGTVCRAESVVVRGRDEDGDPAPVEGDGRPSPAPRHETD